uniref:Uncharacterized protein n=1 Tax=Oryza rufipogon TaxID=4529 RepID=A0A0E0QW81_ORYRU
MWRQMDRDNLHREPGHVHKTVKFWIVRDAFRGHSVLIRIAVPGLILQQELAWTPSFNHWNLEQAPKLNSCWLQLYW